MYTEFFGLNEKPFSISPDPRYLYLSQKHADALAHLIYGISESGGFIQLTGEVGTGKTTLIRSLLEQLPEKTEIALVLNPQLSTKEFLHSICEELRAPKPADDTIKAFIDSLNVKLLEAHAEDRRVVLIVDEAQTLSSELLEQVRLLTNLETAKKKLLQIILIGQPELRDLLSQPDMRQIAQRITGRYHLDPLSAHDTTIYIRHRMKVAGAQADVFSKSAMRRIYRLAGGIPRLINVIADRALLAAYTEERTRIDASLVRRAAAEVFGKSRSRPWWPWAVTAAGLAAFIALTTSVQDSDNPESRLEVAELSSDAVRIDARPDASAADDSLPAEPLFQGERSLSPGDSDALAATTAASESAPINLIERLAMAKFPTDTASAVQELFRLWEIDYVPERGTACDQAEAQGLRCLFLNGGSIGELRRLDRPTILTLIDAEGLSHQIVMSHLGYAEAELSAAGQRLKIDIAELTHAWYGDNMLLWRPLTAVTDTLKPGMRGERVVWLRDALAQLRGSAETSDDPDLYDAGLEDWVRDFQRRNRLSVDGIVGTQTQIALQTSLAPPGTPRLSVED